MQSLPIPVRKKISESIKAGCRFLCRPFLPVMPEAVTNRMPFLGRTCVHGPDNLKVRLHTYGPHGKDRIALKLARHGLDGYEGETIRLFLFLVKASQTVVDIGANTGLFALLAAKAKPTCRVWAFEPVPFIFDMLRNNIRLNQLDNLMAIPAAASDFVGESTFYITRTNVGIPTDSSACQGFRDKVDEYRLPTTTLDAFMESQRIGSLDLLKIDAEAAEDKVVRGALQTIRNHRPYVICEVLEDVDHAYLQQTFQSLQYHFYHITSEQLQRHERLQGSLNVDQRNYLLVPAEKETALEAQCANAGISMSQE